MRRPERSAQVVDSHAAFEPYALDDRGDGPVLMQLGASPRSTDPAEWVAAHAGEIEALLCRRGAVLLRGVGVDDVAAFKAVLNALGARLAEYVERSTPRSRLEGRIFTSTEYPSDAEIPLHNESSYSLDWPRRIFFCCLQPAAQGGQTSLVDSRRVYALLDPAVREGFVRRQVLYARNYGQGVDLTWQEAFQTVEPEVVEERCRRSAIECTWLDGGRTLRTRQVRPAALVHTPSDARVWFNQAHLFHVSSLSPETRTALVELFEPEGLPRHAWYGDGGAIEDGALAEIRRAYAAARVLVEWQRGDVLLLDNLFYAHGRLPFTGTRRIAVAMTEADLSETRPLAGSATALTECSG
jgi:alpha-ketoglutarate-dependent taurine dioxygenase